MYRKKGNFATQEPSPGRSMLSVRFEVLFLFGLSVSEAAVVFDKPPTGGETKTFPEDTTVGTSLYSLQATDSSGTTPVFTIGTAQCESTPAPSSIPSFTIDSLDQLVVPAGGLDAENCTQFRFEFIVKAGGSTATSDPLIIKVIDVNDVAPQFSKTVYRGEVWKNDVQDEAVNGADLITATDPDITKQDITLDIAGAQTTFAINGSGLVYVKTPSGLVDLASPTILTIRASDGLLTATTSLNITVNGNPCSSAPCQNGGTCTSQRGNYKCSCLTGYTGPTCKHVDYCFGGSCQNNGTCTNRDNGYTCNCKKYPYLSTVPENQNCTYRDCCIPNQCEHGGTCTNTRGSITVPDCFTCKCPGLYYGKRCHISKIWLIIAIVVPCVAILAIVVSVWFFYCKQRKEKVCHSDTDLDETERTKTIPPDVKSGKNVANV